MSRMSECIRKWLYLEAFQNGFMPFETACECLFPVGLYRCKTVVAR